MPSLTTTIEENSPLITYVSTWATGVSTADGLASSYSESSFMATQTPGASASFVFNGTGVQIFGAERGNHGPYSVTVDNTQYPTANGFQADPGLFQQSLFEVDGLQLGNHEVTIVNQGTTFLDIDFITWVTDVGQASDTLYVNTIQDTDSSFTYSSGSAWNTNPPKLGSFLGGSGHVTTSPGASFVHTFQARQGISIYGPVDPNGAPYTVELDGGAAQNFSSNKQLYKSQVLLYHANNLLLGQHYVKFTCQPTTSGQSLAVDFANVYTTTPPASGSTNRSQLSAGSIAGITLSIVGVFAILAALFLFFRRRQRLSQYHAELDLSDDSGMKPPDDTQTRVVTISSFGSGPASSRTALNLIPTPFTPSEGSPVLSHFSKVKISTTRARQQVRFSAEESEESIESNSTTRAPSSSVAPPGLQRLPSSSATSVNYDSTRRIALPTTPAPVFQKGPLPGTSAGRTPPGVVPDQDSIVNRPIREDRSSLAPPDYQWATHSQPYPAP